MFPTYAATVGDGDFPSLNVYLTFQRGSPDGAGMCDNVTVNSDDLVESDEDFVIVMALATPAGTNFRLDNTEMVVTLIDSDGKYIVLLFTAVVSSYFSLSLL